MAGWAHTFNQPTFRYNFRGHIKSRTTRNYISKKHKDFFPAPIALYCTVQDFMEILCVFKMNEMILAKYRDLIQTKNFKISNVIINPNQSCFLLNYISVISSIFINKFVQKCQYYYTISDQSVPLVTITSVVSLLTKQL